MSIGLRCELTPQMRVDVQLALELCGGATESCFPDVEAWLLADTEHLEAIQGLASRKSMDRYHSVMDFTVCEIFTIYRPACFRFYRDRGPRLMDMISVETLMNISALLLKAMEMAEQYKREERHVSWTRFREEVLALAA